MLLFLVVVIYVSGIVTVSYGRGAGPTTVAITTAQQQQWIDAHNTERRAITATDMECIVSWSPELATLAQTVSNYCVTKNPTSSTRNNAGFCYRNVGIATYYVLTETATVPTPTTVVQAWKTQGDTYYILGQNRCTAPSSGTSRLTCNNYKQVFLASVSEMGCAITLCDYVDNESYTVTTNGVNPLSRGYVVTCAYDNVATGQRPYTAGTVCSSCPTYKTTCQNNLCCGTDTQCSLSSTIYRRYYNGNSKDHFYTTTAYEASLVLGRSYNNEGILGCAWASRTDTPTCADLTPMYRLYSNSLVDHFYTTNYDQMLAAQQTYGYTYERIEWYCVRNQTNTCGATLPLYRFWSGAAGDHYYSPSASVPNGYTRESTECFIRPCP